MKSTILSVLLLLSAAVFAQTEATTKDGKKVILNSNGTWMYAECSALIKSETKDGKTTHATKEDIKVTADGVTGLKIFMMKGSESVIFNFGTLGKDIKCVRENAPMAITFTDGSTVSVKHMTKLNCEGDFRLFVGEKIGNKDVLDKLMTKTIKKIQIEYSSTENGNLVNTQQEYVFDAESAKKLMQTTQCLYNLQ